MASQERLTFHKDYGLKLMRKKIFVMEFKPVGCEDADKLDLLDIFDRKFFFDLLLYKALVTCL